jgi:hypothetical protein
VAAGRTLSRLLLLVSVTLIGTIWPASLAAQDLGSPSRSHDWSAVAALPSGTEVAITTADARRLIRHLAVAGPDGIVVLQVSESFLADPVRLRLLDMAATQPEALAAVEAGGRLEQGLLRLGPDGVFYAGNRVADLGQVLGRVSRLDIREVSVGFAKRRQWTVIGVLIGTGAGLFFGGHLAGLCEGGTGCGLGMGLGLTAAGAGAGGLLGWASNRPDVLYRAP